MRIVTDSSPLQFLVRLGSIDVLPKLFGTVVVPRQVESELKQPSTPDVVRRFMESIPSWMTVQAPQLQIRLRRLDLGEEAAINLALEINADFVLIDDWAARQEAKRLGLNVVGLLGVLERADEHDFVNLSKMAIDLPHDYRIDPKLVKAAVDRSLQRRTAQG